MIEIKFELCKKKKCNKRLPAGTGGLGTPVKKCRYDQFCVKSSRVIPNQQLSTFFNSKKDPTDLKAPQKVHSQWKNRNHKKKIHDTCLALVEFR